MKRLAAVIVMAAALAGCGGGGGAPMAERATRSESVTDAAGLEAAAPVAVALEAAPDAGGEAAPASPGAPAGPVLLAYAYGVTIETPVAQVEAIAKAHERACLQAGPQTCQVLGASVQRYGEDQIGAQLSLRAEPRWLAGFRDGLEGDAKKLGGRIVEQTMSSEDLTRAITDTEARLRAQKTLRDRLQQILRERPGKLGDLLETERELARVQGEIDAAESVLAVMRARVDMSTLTLSYQTKSNPVAASALAPIGAALNGFVATMAGGLAGLITLVAVLLPWVVIGGPLAWLAWRWIARWRGKKKGAPAEG